MIIESMIIGAVAKGLYSACPLSWKRKIVDIVEKKFDHINNDEDVLDGKFLSCNECGSSGQCGKTSSGKGDAPKKGKRPKGCTASKLKKVVFVNGINTNPEDNCTTSKKLADAMCCEVISFYNKTNGTLNDVSECIKNIKGEDNEPARALGQYLKEHQDEEITIVAHSQGGLITRQALKRREADLISSNSTVDAKNKMSKIKVISCGTAENGWPEGPSYEQYTNKLDPVPKAIAAADDIYSVSKTNDSSIIRHRFIGWHPKEIKASAGHGVDDVYLPKIAKNEKVPNNDCLTCSKKSYIKSA